MQTIELNYNSIVIHYLEVSLSSPHDWMRPLGLCHCGFNTLLYEEQCHLQHLKVTVKICPSGWTVIRLILYNVNNMDQNAMQRKRKNNEHRNVGNMMYISHENWIWFILVRLLVVLFYLSAFLLIFFNTSTAKYIFYYDITYFQESLVTQQAYFSIVTVSILFIIRISHGLLHIKR